MGVFRVWQFIDSWGIINYQAGAGAADDADGVPVNVQPAGSHTPLLHPSACCSSLGGMHVEDCQHSQLGEQLYAPLQLVPVLRGYALFVAK